MVPQQQFVKGYGRRKIVEGGRWYFIVLYGRV
jgi:hypothetical protein